MSQFTFDEMKETLNEIAYSYNAIRGKYEGDSDIVLGILNGHEPLQHKECQEYKEDIPGLNVDLYDYQKKGVQWMLNMEQKGLLGIHGGLLCDEMGLGKTVQTIALMLIQRARNKKAKKDRTIILTPVTLMDQWVSELNRIARQNLFEIVKYYGPDRDKIPKAKFEECDVVISTIDTFSNSVKNSDNLISTLPSECFSRIVIDECPELSNGKMCEYITKFCELKNIKNRWAISGTPIGEDIAVDLSGQCAVIGMPFDTYCKSLAGPIPKDGNTLTLDLTSKECRDRISNFLELIMIRRTKSHVQSSPDFPKFKAVQEQVIDIKMSAKEQSIYLATIPKVNKQQILNSLRKVCNHPGLVFADKAKIDTPSAKINELMKTINDIQNNHKGDKILVFSNFTETFKIISKQLDERGIKYRECIAGSSKKQRVRGLAEFKDETQGYNILLISTSCASVGINLQCANHIIFVDPRFNGGADNQAIGRCWRLGQIKQVYVYRLITKGTVEERLRELMLKASKRNMVNLWGRKTMRPRERKYVIHGKK